MESNLEAAVESRTQTLVDQKTVSVSTHEPDSSPVKSNFGDEVVPCLKLVECRICQDEDLDSNMEMPCSCRGSLKYAHRSCVQRWCNEKGDTTCEICLQQFKPGYTAPSQLFHYGGVPMNFRGQDFVDADYDDHASENASIFYCRIVAIILMVLLLLSHILPVIISFGDGEYSLAELLLIMFRTVAVLLPVYVMSQALAVFQRRRRQLERMEFPAPTYER